MSRRLTEDDFHQRYVKVGDCWLWTGPKVNSGYGLMGGRMLAHRWSHEHFIGPIPEGMQVDHSCRQKLCVNPAHLEAVSPKVNSRRWADTITHCPRGHAYEGWNLLPQTLRRGERTYTVRGCRTCHNARVADYERRKRAEAKAAAEPR